MAWQGFQGLNDAHGQSWLCSALVALGHGLALLAIKVEITLLEQRHNFATLGHSTVTLRFSQAM